jgi:hypothetical protein
MWLALSEGTSQIGVALPHLKKEIDPVSETMSFLVILDSGQSSTKAQSFWMSLRVQPLAD